jgi:hypothetical protein
VKQKVNDISLGYEYSEKYIGVKNDIHVISILYVSGCGALIVLRFLRAGQRLLGLVWILR